MRLQIERRVTTRRRPDGAAGLDGESYGRAGRALTTQLANQGTNMRSLEAARVQYMHTMIDMQGKLMAKAAETSRVRFVDVKGIGRPSVFHYEVKAWSSWSFKLGNFLEGSRRA